MANIKFRAGKTAYAEDTNVCTPLPQKGEITITKPDPEEPIYSLVWKPVEGDVLGAATEEAPDDELMLIPGDVELRTVKCGTGRVFALVFSSGETSMFWMQNSNQDEELGKWTAEDKRVLREIREILQEEPEAEPEAEAAESAAGEKNVIGTTSGDSGDSGDSAAKPQFDVARLAQMFSRAQVHSIEQVVTPAMAVAAVHKMPFERVKSILAEHVDTGYFDKPLAVMDEAELRQALASVVSSGFYRGAQLKLSSAINQNYAGQMVAQAFGLSYKGEGVVNFLDSVREQGLREKSQEKGHTPN